MLIHEVLARSVETFLTQYPPTLLCQSCFIFATVAVLTVAATPASTRRLLTQYGARSATKPSKGRQDDESQGDAFARFLDWATSFGQVPHSWFIHFYILSVLSSIFWAWQYYVDGSVLDFLARSQAASAGDAMTMNQVALTWLLMGLQGTRRLYEYLFVTKPSSSTMWIVHWLLGSAYYVGVGVAVWIEGSSSILHSNRASPIKLETPSIAEVVVVSVFLLAWSMQYKCHKYLSSLRKYSLPEEGMFRYLVCPHYTCECVLYLALAVVAAPGHQLYNKTLMCAWLFVSVNLGVTAIGTKKWYADKFGSDKVRGKWKMIPLLY